MKTAAQDGVQELYHYQGKNVGFLKDVLTNSRVLLSNPKNFNDPWDCNPYFDVDVDDPADRRKWGERLDGMYHDLPVQLRQQLETQWKGNWYDNKALLQQSINKITATVRELTVERWRIYCLTPHPNSLLLWAHYDEKHQGIRLEFDAGIEQIGRAQRVVYSDTLPIIGPDAFADPKALVDAVLLTKSREWSYEDEYRVLARDHDIDPTFSTKTQKDYLSAETAHLNPASCDNTGISVDNGSHQGRTPSHVIEKDQHRLGVR